MDHGDQKSGKYAHNQCSHGMCLNHGPEWENVGDKFLIPDPGFLGNPCYWFTRCCGKAMARQAKVQSRRCKKCGRMERHIIERHIALCTCCGRTKDMTPEYTHYE